MVDKDKVILMTKLAQRDKNHMKRDREIVNHDRRYYVYINNLKTRLSILLVAVTLIGAYFLWEIEEGLNIPTSQDELMQVYVYPSVKIILVCLIVATIVSSLVHRKRYNEANARVKEYNEISKELVQLYENENGGVDDGDR
ncbi:MAG: hypothetical protein ATN35_00350 [Epulopiscium sp. Nele67-Bin004]|nr:MAG: hypothetical protein ATN35_00350 [Epulopiscium sp. Nele67-Bin004]